MFCTQCGTNNADNAMICVQCGRTLQAGNPPAVMPPGGIAPSGVIVPNYLVFAILATVFCCLPTGIPAIVFAAQVNGKLQAGDIVGAQAASKNAKMWCWISLGAGLAVMAIYGILIAVGVVSNLNR